MLFLDRARRAWAVALVLCAGLAAAQQVPPPQAAPDLAQLAAYVKQQFGPGFKVTPVRSVSVRRPEANIPPVVLLTADLDRDGAEDAVIVAQAANPLVDQQSYGYKVIDPYDAYFGFGDPKVTRQFGTGDPEHEHVLLIVHGWRLPQPKAKYCVINLPFDNLAIGSAVYKKKPRATIVATEAGMMESAIFWDGKRYRYEPGMGEGED